MGPVYPKTREIEKYLLLAIIKRGGSIWFSRDGEAIEAELANQFELTKEERFFSHESINSKGHRKWRNHIQFVRDYLVKRSELDASKRDRWVVTRKGYERVGRRYPTEET